MKRVLSIFGILAAGLVFSSCNTTIGFGRDLRMLGEGMENQSMKARGEATDDPGAPVY